MDALKKTAEFFLCFAYLVGTIGAVGYLAFIEQYVIMAAVIVVAALAAPKVWDMFKDLTE